MSPIKKQRRKQRGGITGKGFVKGDQRINRTKPGPGRPPLKFKDWLREWFAEDKTRAKLQAMAFQEASVMNRLLAYAEGLPLQEIGGEGGGPLTVRIIHEYQGGK